MKGQLSENNLKNPQDDGFLRVIDTEDISY